MRRQEANRAPRAEQPGLLDMRIEANPCSLGERISTDFRLLIAADMAAWLIAPAPFFWAPSFWVTALMAR